jgi:hypothetical protein
VNDVVTYVCVRADHQWGTGDAGQVHPKDDGLAWCPDASLDSHERHEWRACEAAPLAAAASLAAHLAILESAVS